MDSSGAAFPTVVDRDNTLSGLYGFKAIPNCLLVDESGVLRYALYGGFDIADPALNKLVSTWVTTGVIETDLSSPDKDAPGPRHAEALDLFRRGESLYQRGSQEEAMALWRQAVALEPDNYVVRKQIWAVEHPDKFYQGDVDYDWQREQMDQGL